MFKRYRAWIQKISACGYIAPHNPKVFSFVMSVLRFLIFIQVGRVRVLGQENLTQVEGPIIVCPNHPHYIDAAIFPNLMKKKGRYLVDEDVLRFGFGLGAAILVPGGAFPARDGTRSGNLRSCKVAVQFLAAGEPVLIFPEGHTNFNSKMQPLKKGAIRIAKLACRSLEKPIYIVPAYVRYGRYFPLWIQRIKPPLQYLIVLLGFAYFRRGATVVFGTPISSAEFPSSDKEACDFLSQKISALDPVNESQGVVAGMYEILPLIKL